MSKYGRFTVSISKGQIRPKAILPFCPFNITVFKRYSHERPYFLFCRYETTAAALNFTTYLLAKHPEIQRRLQEEIDAKFGDQTRLRNYRLVDITDLLSENRVTF